IWEESEEPKAYKKRQEVLNALKERLLSEQPPEKKIRIPKIYKCEWNIGDVFAFKLESQKAEEMGLLNRYLIIQKIDETICEQGHTVPIVYVRLSKDDRLPESEEEINAMEFVNVSFSIKLSREENRKVSVPECVMIIVSTSKRVIPKKLIYLGNYKDLNKPEKEHYPRKPNYMINIKWGKEGSAFEENMLTRYGWFNLKSK
ncbi:MAG: hypothetical protein K5662_06885, partial [Lachnospiraceae bacterium]|nr:hypothetical protein [Lachnospiraceae bacterium]